jgi:hypothetical protein
MRISLARRRIAAPYARCHTALPPHGGVDVDTAAKEARRALNRLRHALDKADVELGALRHAEAGDFPATDFEQASEHVRLVLQFVEEQEQRLQEKVLHAGGIEPGRVRRGS